MSSCKVNRYSSSWEYSPCGRPTVAEVRDGNDADYEACEEHTREAKSNGARVRRFDEDTKVAS